MDSEDFIINEIVFSTRFALSLDKISGTSAIKMKVFSLSFCIALGLHYLCRQNAEMVENIVYRRDTRNEWHDAGFRLRPS